MEVHHAATSCRCKLSLADHKPAHSCCAEECLSSQSRDPHKRTGPVVSTLKFISSCSRSFSEVLQTTLHVGSSKSTVIS